MERSKIDMFIAANGQKFPAEKLGIIQAQLERTDDNRFLPIQAVSYKDPVLIFIISLFFGSFGVDRFLLGQVGLGILKLITCGGLGVWWLVDLFLIMGTTKDHNFSMFTQSAV